jgi:hypothetical protein
VESCGYDLAAHVAALARHDVRADVVLAEAGSPRAGAIGIDVVEAHMAARGGRVHDPAALGVALRALTA